jgi:hypothetical protein
MRSSATFLDDVQLAIASRRKPLRYKVRGLEVQRSADGESEKLAIECMLQGIQRTVVRLLVWPDRWIWIDARQSSKAGWIWQFTTEGRLRGGLPAATLSQALEDSLAAAHAGSQASSEELRKLWEPLLARGPQAMPDNASPAR